MTIKKLVFLTLLASSLTVQSAESIKNIDANEIQLVGGNSSEFKNGVWLVINGTHGSAECNTSSKNKSYFYARPESDIEPEMALSMLMAAKFAKNPISIEYVVEGGITNSLWGYGTSSCKLVRVSLD